MNKFLQAYMVAALWSSIDDEQNSLDDTYSIDDIAPESKAKMEKDCEKFQKENAKLLELSGMDDERAGHNFWLNRNHHGSGFWDEHSFTTCPLYDETLSFDESIRKSDSVSHRCPCPYHICQRLSAKSHEFGECSLYVHEGQIYCE